MLDMSWFRLLGRGECATSRHYRDENVSLQNLSEISRTVDLGGSGWLMMPPARI